MITDFQDLLGDEDTEMLDMMGESSLLGESYDLDDLSGGGENDEVDLMGGRLRDRIRKAIKKRRARRKKFKESLKGKSFRERVKLRYKNRKARRKRIFKKIAPFIPIPGFRAITAGMVGRKLLQRRKARKLRASGGGSIQQATSTGFKPSSQGRTVRVTSEGGFVPDGTGRRRRRRVRPVRALRRRIQQRRQMQDAGLPVQDTGYTQEEQIQRAPIEQLPVAPQTQQEEKPGGGIAKFILPIAAGVGAMMLLGG